MHLLIEQLVMPTFFCMTLVIKNHFLIPIFLMLTRNFYLRVNERPYLDALKCGSQKQIGIAKILCIKGLPPLYNLKL